MSRSDDSLLSLKERVALRVACPMAHCRAPIGETCRGPSVGAFVHASRIGAYNALVLPEIAGKVSSRWGELEPETKHEVNKLIECLASHSLDEDTIKQVLRTARFALRGHWHARKGHH